MPPEQPSPENQPSQESERSIEEIDAEIESIEQQKEAAKEADELEKALELKQQVSALENEREEKLLAAQEEAGRMNERVDEIDEQINEKEAQKQAAKEAGELEEALRLKKEVEDLEKEREQLMSGSEETSADDGVGESEPEAMESQEGAESAENNGADQEDIDIPNAPEQTETPEERQKKINEIKRELGMEVEGSPSSSESAEQGLEHETETYIQEVAKKYTDLQDEYINLKEQRQITENERERLITVEEKFRDLKEEILETTSGMSDEEIKELRNKNSGFRHDRLRAAMNQVLGTDLPVMSEDLVTKEVEGHDQLYVDYKDDRETEGGQENKKRLAEARYDFFDTMQEAVGGVSQLSEEEKEELRASDEYKMLMDVLGKGGGSTSQAIKDVYNTVVSNFDTMSDAASPISVYERDYPNEVKQKLDQKYNSSPRDMERFMKDRTGGALERIVLYKVAKDKGYIE